MADKFRHTYRIPSARHPNWDYGCNAAYFVTICTKHREHLFGHIENQIMIKSPLGNDAFECWQAIPTHFPFVRLGAFVVMPNHVHGIIIIDRDNVIGGTVETQNFASLQSQQPTFHRNKFGPQSQNLASVVRGYKIGVMKLARNGMNTNNDGNTPNGGDGRGDGCKDAKFCVSTVTGIPQTIWQPRYHDHIIRNADEYKRIETYIINNPGNWEEDKFYNGQCHED